MKLQSPRISPAVARKLGYYVYLYVNPINENVFYVGKGKGGRALAHLHVDEKRAISKTIRAIQRSGREPRIEILAHGLPNPQAALRVEAAAIDLLGLDTLDNLVHGQRAKYGRGLLEDVIAQYTQRRANVVEPTILIRINKLYRYGMTDIELYDATRSAWRVGPKRDKAKYAFSVFEGIVREVYRINRWLPAGSTFNVRREGRGVRSRERWEFVGTIADESVRHRYVNRYVGHLFDQGAQNPISYVNCD